MQQELLHLIVKTSKEDSVFVYFALESNEGLAFYSTLPHQRGDQDRRIDLKVTRSLEPELRNLMSSLAQRIPSLTIEVDEYVADGRELEDIFNSQPPEQGHGIE